MDMGDIGLLPFDQLAAIFGVMAASPQHRYFVLSKHLAELRAWFDWIQTQTPEPWTHCHWEALATEQDTPDDPIHRLSGDETGRPWPLPNVRIGTSVCTQDDVNRHVPELLQIPAALRFLSMEPLLESVQLTHVDADAAGSRDFCQINALTGKQTDMGRPCPDVPRVDWVIVGGESGPKARPCDVAWIRDIVEVCWAASVPCFIKQVTVDGTITNNPKLFPADLRVRQMPEVRR